MATQTWNMSGTASSGGTGNGCPDQLSTGGDAIAAGRSGAAAVQAGASVAVDSLVLDDPSGSVAIDGSLTVADTLNVAAGSLVNNGVLDVGGLQVAGTIDNSGFMVVRGPAGSAAFSHIGNTGVLEVLGVIENAGSTLDTAPLGQTVSAWGTIDGGLVLGKIGNATLNGVTLVGTTGLWGDVTFQAMAWFGSVLSGFDGAAVSFAAPETFDTAAATGLSAIRTDSSLDIGAAGTIGATSGTTTLYGPAIGNRGLIVAGASNGYLGSDGNTATIRIASGAFVNAGVLAAIDRSAPVADTQGLITHDVPGVASMQIAAGRFDNTAGGIILAVAGSGHAGVTIAAGTDLTNDGLITTGVQSSIGRGTIDIEAAVKGSGTLRIANGGALEAGAAVSQSQTVVFDGPGLLVIDQPAFLGARSTVSARAIPSVCGTSAHPWSAMQQAH